MNDSRDLTRLVPPYALKCSLGSLILIGLAFATPMARADLFSGTYEGILVAVDGDDSTTKPARAVVTQIGPLLTISIFHDHSTGFILVDTFEAVASGNSFMLVVSPFIDVTGTIDGASLQIVKTIQGTPLLINTYTLTCVSDCPEPEPGEDPEDGPCAETPATVTWVGGATGSFDNPENWEGDQIPPDSTIAVFRNDGTGPTDYVMGVTQNILKEGLSIQSVSLLLESLTQTYSLAGLCGPSILVTGFNRNANIEIGTLMTVSADEIRVAAASGNLATVVVSDTGVLDAQLISLGESLSGITGLDLLGSGRCRTTDMQLAAGAVVSVSEPDSELTVRSGGTVVVADTCRISVREGGAATFNGALEINGNENSSVIVRDADSVWTSTVTSHIGLSSMGRFEVRDRAKAFLADVLIGDQDGASGILEVAGEGEVNSSSVVVVGQLGFGTLEIHSGGSVKADSLRIGAFDGGNGTATIQDPVSELTVLNEAIIGDAGEGSIHVSDGAAFAAESQLTIGKDASGVGMMRVTEFTTLVAIYDATIVGEKGVGTLVIADRGRVDSNGVSSIGAFAGSRGTVIVAQQDSGNRSEWVTSDTLNVGFSGKGDLDIRDFGRVSSVDAILGVTESGNGLVEVTKNAVWTANEVRVGGEGIGTVMLDGTGTVQAALVGVSSIGTLNAVQIQIGGAAAPQGVSLSGNSKSRGSAQLIEESTDPSPGLFTRSLLIEEGAAINAESVQLEDGGMLGGTGWLSFDIKNLGRIRPGADDCSIGSLTIAGDYEQTSNGILEIKIAGTASDHLAIDGSANLGGTLAISFLESDTSPVGRSFEILTAARISGIFEVIGADKFDIEYGANSVRVTVRTIGPSELVKCSEIGSLDQCGSGLCGTGLIPTLMLLPISLIGRNRRALAGNTHRECRQREPINSESWRKI